MKERCDVYSYALARGSVDDLIMHHTNLQDRLDTRDRKGSNGLARCPEPTYASSAPRHAIRARSCPHSSKPDKVLPTTCASAAGPHARALPTITPYSGYSEAPCQIMAARPSTFAARAAALCHEDLCRTCCRWPHSSSATQFPSESQWNPTIRRRIPPPRRDLRTGVPNG